ncbi:MAG: hypothetical protein H6838_04080 [Planctomycetes bacterium]|nr:hypothetical protein [Planctomycetota bacterium]
MTIALCHTTPNLAPPITPYRHHRNAFGATPNHTNDIHGHTNCPLKLPDIRTADTLLKSRNLARRTHAGTTEANYPQH